MTKIKPAVNATSILIRFSTVSPIDRNNIIST